MIIDINELAQEYAKSYLDKTRIYFIEKYLSTFNAEKGKNSPFILFPRQKEFIRSITNYPASIAIKHRQAGITTVTSAWAAAQMVFAGTEAPETILCIGNKLDLSQQLVTKIRDFLSQVPRWFWGDEYYDPDPKSPKNKKDIFIKNSKSELVLFNGSAVYARSSGANAARGISAVSILIFDEAAFIEDGLSVYSSAVAATASVPNRKIIMVSTPNGKDELYYDTYRKALAKENNYNAVEFKWYQDLRYNKHLKWYKKNEKTGEKEWIIEKELDDSGAVEYNEEKWRQLEKDGWTPTSPWYEEMCKSFNNDPMKIAQELDVSFMGSANNVVSPEAIEMQEKENVREPLENMKDPMVQETWFWEPPIEGHRYILSCDPSRGDAADRTAIEVIDMDAKDENGLPVLTQAMEYIGRKLGDEVGQMIYNYATLYNDAFVVVDATGGVGDAALLTLLNLGYDKKNIFYDDPTLKKYTAASSQDFMKDEHDRMPGFHMQGNRYPMLSLFAGMIRNNEFKVRSIRVINELDTWIFKGETGRMDHMSGSHDDSLTCLAMGLFVMQYSFNKIEATKKKDSAILKAYMSGGKYTYIPRNKSIENGGSIRPKYNMPFYRPKNEGRTAGSGSQGAYLWLFSGYH